MIQLEFRSLSRWRPHFWIRCEHYLQRFGDGENCPGPFHGLKSCSYTAAVKNRCSEIMHEEHDTVKIRWMNVMVLSRRSHKATLEWAVERLGEVPQQIAHGIIIDRCETLMELFI